MPRRVNRNTSSPLFLSSFPPRPDAADGPIWAVDLLYYSTDKNASLFLINFSFSKEEIGFNTYYQRFLPKEKEALKI